jgi:hypothetical protein
MRWCHGGVSRANHACLIHQRLPARSPVAEIALASGFGGKVISPNYRYGTYEHVG